MSSISIHPGRQHCSNSIDPNAATRIGKGLLMFCFLTIALISAMDIWFAVANSSILIVEKNPICMALIRLDPQSFTYFILGKATGTAMVLVMLNLLQRIQYRHANMVMIAITVFQIGLLMHLTLSDPHTYNLPNFGLLFRETPESIWSID